MSGLSRRQLLAQGLQLAAGAAGAGLLAGCRPIPRATLLHGRGELPQAWLQRLPAPWRAQVLDTPAAVLAARSRAQLLQLGDGWASSLAPAGLAPLGPTAAAALSGLDPELAAAPSRLFRPAGSPALAFPWAFGTWVLLLRNRPDLLARRQEGWRLLLEPSLRGRLVLPSSPRLVIELAARQLAEASSAAAPGALASGAPQFPGPQSPGLDAQLRQLRAQALAFDDVDGLNLLLAGDAEAAVVPSQRAVPLLRRDQRLAAFLPASGSPLWWNLLLRPAGSATPPPAAWLEALAEPPLLERLIAGGWLPPLPRSQLAPLLARWPAAVAALLLPPAPVLARCSNLAPLSAAERATLQALWDGSAGSAP
ncbi:MAG: hypothetical protein VKM97_02465 [Cyanobacteriota bacterium]|nr:hypothetical protein [Cyanobacteriota bacterium]